MHNYNGNVNLKSSGVKIQFTVRQAMEYMKCQDDYVYFIKSYCRIVSLDKGLIPFELYDYQTEFLSTVHDNKYVISMLARQMGKTQTVAAYILWYVLFQDNKTCAILANKSAAAREVLSRVKYMYECLPVWMQQGVKTWNKGDIELENGSKVFCSGTSASGIRSRSCVTEDTRVCICDDYDNIFYVEISTLINNSKLVEVEKLDMFYAVYKTTNLVNGKIYVGFHKTINPNDGYLGSGKLIKRAIEKYGVENFKKEILAIFDNQKEAEDYEASIVDKDFTLREDTYNIAIGGNVRIMYGENNGFYGRKHSEEIRQKIKAVSIGNKYFSIAKNYALIRCSDGKEFFDIKDACLDEGISKWLFLHYIGEGKYVFKDQFKQIQFMERYRRRMERHALEKEKKRKITSDRFKGKKLPKEQAEKIGKSVFDWIKNNPEAHAEKMMKINKNPEKIKKTADTHRGMKRSKEARERMSNAAKGKTASNKGSIQIYNTETLETKYIKKEQEIPLGWSKGNPKTKGVAKGKCYTNGIKTIVVSQDEVVPDGFVLGVAWKS